LTRLPVAADVETRIGVLRLSYADRSDARTLSAARMCSWIAVLNVLHGASMRMTESGLDGDCTLAMLIATARYLPPPPQPPDVHIRWLPPDTRQALIMGGQLLSVPNEARRWRRPMRHRTRARALMERAVALWTPPASSGGRFDARLARVSFESPFELVAIVTLGTAGTITSFSILVRALRSLYGNLRGFELDEAEIDAQIASIRAYQSEQELNQALTESRRLRINAVRGLDGGAIAIPPDHQLDLESGEASIEER
jgi:hypothetical protein